MTANVIPGLEAPAFATPIKKVVGPVLVVTQGPDQPALPTHKFLIDLANRFEDSEPDLATRISCVASHLTLFQQAHESLRGQLQRKSAEVDQLRKELGGIPAMKEYRCVYRGRVKGGFLVVFRAENGHKLRIKSHRRGEHYDFVRRGTCYFVDRKEDVWQVA